jgi:hypothetical protein
METHRTQRSAIVRAVVALLLGVLTLGGAPAAAAAARPDATLPHLGPAPQRCFQYGSSDNICNGASFPYPPNANYLYATYYGTVYITPHIARLGQDVTANAVPDFNGIPSWATPPGRIMAGCKPTDTFCKWKADSASAYPPNAKAPGGGYSEYDMTFCGFNGCASSGDFYYVLPKKRAISGMVLGMATNPKTGGTEVVPIDGAVVQIDGPSSGTAVTDSAGFYDALVDPGHYTVKVTGSGGQSGAGTPTACAPGSVIGSSCKLDVSGADGTANFQQCPSVPAPAPALDPLARAAAASSAQCPLKVFVKIVGPIANVGTRSGLALDNGLPDEGPVNFTIPTYSKTGSPFGAANEVAEQCESGCANLLVTVIDPQTQKPAAGATIEAKLGQIDTAGSPNLHQQGIQFLCTQSADPTTRQCGTDLTGLTTDSGGQLRLIYWAPGELVSAHTDIDVSATATCSATECTSGQEAGSATSKISVKPYLIYKHRGAITANEADALREIVGNPAIGDLLSAGAHKVLDLELHALLHAELIDEAVLDAAEGPLGYAIVQLVDLAGAFSELKEQWALQEAFLQAAGVEEAGLDGPPFDKQVAARSVIFDQAILHGVPNAFHIAAGGFLWDLGKELVRRYGAKPKNQLPAQHVSIQAYEVSTCSDRSPDCGPGYLDQPGIVPRLCFFISWDIGLDQTLCTPPYNAVAWMTIQRTHPGFDPALP